MSRRSLWFLAMCTGGLPVLLSTGTAEASWSTTGTGGGTAVTSTMTAPGTPLLAQTGPSIAVSWAAASAPSGLTYVVERELAGSGSWSEVCPPTPTLSCTDGVTVDGTYDYRVRAVLGSWTSLSPTSASVNVTVFVAAPSVPDLPAADDTGVSATDNLTSVTTPRVTGTATAGSTVTLYVDGTAAASQVLGAGQTAYSFVMPVLTEGAHAVRATATLNTTSSAPSPTLTLTIDTVIPTLKTLLRNAAEATKAAAVDWTATFSEEVVGVDPSDFAVVATGLAGTAPTPTSVLAATATSYTVTAGTGSGDGTLRIDGLANGSVTDSAGNVLTGPLTGESYTVDRTAPLVVAVAGGATPNGTVEITDTLSVTFNEPIAAVPTGTQTLTFTRGGGRSGTVATISGLTGAAFDPGSDYTSARSTATFSGLLTLSADRRTVVFTITADGNCTTTNKKTTCTLITGSAGFVSGFLPSAGLLDDAGNAALQVLYSQPATPTSLLF